MHFTILKHIYRCFIVEQGFDGLEYYKMHNNTVRLAFNFDLRVPNGDQVTDILI